WLIPRFELKILTSRQQKKPNDVQKSTSPTQALTLTTLKQLTSLQKLLLNFVLFRSYAS
ncbi:uncharacterized protein METZ01_LOCUS188991, partial [marine metagenome]